MQCLKDSLIMYLMPVDSFPPDVTALSRTLDAYCICWPLFCVDSNILLQLHMQDEGNPICIRFVSFTTEEGICIPRLCVISQGFCHS